MSPPKETILHVSTTLCHLVVPEPHSADFNQQIDTLLFHHQSRSVEQHYGIPNDNPEPIITISDKDYFRVESPIFFSPKNGDTGFDIDTLLLPPKYDFSPLCINTNDSNTFLPDPAQITSLASSFFCDIPSMNTHPRVHPNSTTQSDCPKPNKYIYLRSMTAL
ncbi:unnamed protein product [Vicia faba]|uniref:Uncharacterized protein n=1 Tax=Vicia faba TaxID=3906 RepID=A0AAV1B478_VICFA|nr:unnamed protein product [Vicia faba]